MCKYLFHQTICLLLCLNSNSSHAETLGCFGIQKHRVFQNSVVYSWSTVVGAAWSWRGTLVLRDVTASRIWIKTLAIGSTIMCLICWWGLSHLVALDRSSCNSKRDHFQDSSGYERYRPNPAIKRLLASSRSLKIFQWMREVPHYG